MTVTLAAPLSVRIEDDLYIPPEMGDLEAFRRWALSDQFPERGRIDYLQGTIEVDMTGEELQSHGVLKSALHLYIGRVVSEADLGQVFVDRARFTSMKAGLSCEPDVLYVSWASLESGRARYVRASEAQPDKLREIEGTVDLVVEVVSDSSVRKDTERLPLLHALAGVPELWIADARGQELSFRILHLARRRYRAAAADAEGYQLSKVLGRRIRLRRQPGRLPGTWRYLVDEAPSPVGLPAPGDGS